MLITIARVDIGYYMATAHYNFIMDIVDYSLGVGYSEVIINYITHYQVITNYITHYQVIINYYNTDCRVIINYTMDYNWIIKADGQSITVVGMHLSSKQEVISMHIMDFDFIINCSWEGFRNQQKGTYQVAPMTAAKLIRDAQIQWDTNIDY